MREKYILKHLFIVLILTVLAINTVFAQTTAFNYQGRLSESDSPVTGTRLFQFTLFDENGAAIPGAVISQTLTVTNGVFNANLDFGAANFPSATRTLQIAVKINAGDAYTILNPRQPVLSTPYSIQSKNSAQLGGVDAGQYVTTTSVGSSFIKNATTQQTGNFNISGNGVIGGRIGVGIAAPRSALDVVGVGLISPGGSGGGTMQFSTSNSETAMSFVGGSNRADIRYDGTTLKLLANGGPLSPDSLYGINITNLGNVGIGLNNPAARLHVFNPVSGANGNLRGKRVRSRRMGEKHKQSRHLRRKFESRRCLRHQQFRCRSCR